MSQERADADELDELAEASERIQDLREEIRDDLAADLGGEPDDYRAETHLSEDERDQSDEAVPDGGESATTHE